MADTPTPTEPAAEADAEPTLAAADGPRRRWLRRVGWVVGTTVLSVVLVVASAWAALSVEGSATPSPAAHGSDHDAEWLGHAWVDGRRSQVDVDALAAALRSTGIRDLFVHAGPFSDDGTLDRALRPRARWLTGALHAALPGVRVQAWLGAHPGDVDLASARTHANLLGAMEQVLDDGFDGVHLDMEPVDNGDRDMVSLLVDAHTLTRQHHVVLSLSASLLAPAPAAGLVAVLPGRHALWSPGYLSELAAHVDQVAVMAYDTWSWTPSVYAGYVRRMTTYAQAAVPAGVALFIGVPAYHDGNLRHRTDVETLAAAIRGVRLALDDEPSTRAFGLAIYVDFTATADDWATYQRDWQSGS